MDENERQDRAEKNRSEVERIVAETDALIEQSRKLVIVVHNGRRAEDRPRDVDGQEPGQDGPPDTPLPSPP